MLVVVAVATAYASTRWSHVEVEPQSTLSPAPRSTTTTPATPAAPTEPHPSAPPTTPPTAPPDPTPATTPAVSGPEVASAAWDELTTLRVAEPAPDLVPYRRAAFGDGWDYDPATGCNTRERVLIEEAVQEPIVDDRCRSTGGRWVSLYDGVEVDSVADLQIDHLVPLAEAWRSGAAEWTQERREAFSNDLTHPDSLIAVTGFTNQSKGDSPPHRWMPPDPNAWCTYAEMWVGVKARWDLSVTEAEHAALVAVLTGC